jgi:hypothetical protein
MTKHLLALALVTIGWASIGNGANDSHDPPRPSVSDSSFSTRATAPGETHVVGPADTFPCRLTAASNRDVVQLSIGRVDSLRCNSLYSPSRDEAITFVADHVAITRQGDGFRVATRGPLRIREQYNFMKTKRGLPFFRPLDKSVSPRAPAGWCSWYVFWQGIREEQVTQNTDWLSANLKQFGCDYVQIDDGWQGVGQGDGVNRDWHVTEKNKFPHGMKWLADYIRAKGLKPGLWLIPFATSDSKRFREQPELFVRRADGSSVYETPNATTGKTDVDWTGRYVIDPTSPKAHAWFTDLFHMICDQWGYDYVKIDGQGGSAGVCRQYRDRLADPKISPDDAYRSGLATIKLVMGPKRFLLNCGQEYASCGYCEGIRTGNDVGGPDWTGMQSVVNATMQRLYVNHLSFWTDPDVVCVRPPLTLDQARVWATLVGITGQLLMTSDDMPKLGEDRVEILRRIFPVADIRPMDLYPLSGKPRIFDLRVSTPQAGQWDVVALFNWDTRSTASLRLDPKELGWPAGGYVYYDVWEKKLLGIGKSGLTLGLPPTSCKLLAARPVTGHPQLVGTSRHITQGADDLVEARWDAAAGKWIGRSRVVGGDPYQLRFTLPPGWTCAAPKATIEGPLAVFTLRSDQNQTHPWQVRFQQRPAAANKPQINHAKVTGADSTATISWQGAGAVAYRVYRNGDLLAQTGDTSLIDRGRPQGSWKYEVAAIDWQGGETARMPAGVFQRTPMPRTKAADAWLDEMNPSLHEQDYGGLVPRRSVDQNPLRIGGKEFSRGLGTHANSQVQFPLGNRYRRFEALVGVDDEKQGAGSVVFQVVVDGRKVFDSGVMRGKQPAKKVSVPLDGAEELLLVVTDAGDGITCDHADWADARLIGNR